MLCKIQQIFETHTEGAIKDKEHLQHFFRKLIDRKILIEHDIPLLNKYILDFPVTFDQFCQYTRQIFKFEIEQQLECKVLNYEECFSKIIKYLNFYSYSELSSDDLYEILHNLNLNITNIKTSLQNIHKVDFLLKNIRDDIQKFLWDRIQENEANQNENDNPDFFICDAAEYQHKMQAKIEYEYEIIRTKRVQNLSDKENGQGNKVKKVKKILVEKAKCADRGIPIQTWKIPHNFFDREVLSEFYYRCEAFGQLLLSKHFQKFAGFDDLSFDEYQIYFFEYIEGVQIIPLIQKLQLDMSESSILFKYLAKEILNAFRDLLYKCTFTFKLPITIDNIFYEPSQFRLYFQNLQFGPPRKTILESHQITEAKLLFAYGLILLRMLSLGKPELGSLIEYINSVCNDFHEFEHMQKIFDHIFYIEEVLTKNLENDIIICIIIQCLISPYTAKIVFDEFYSNKNFLKDVIMSKEDSGIKSNDFVPRKKETNIKNLTVQDDEDKYVANEPYFKKEEGGEFPHKEERNEIRPKKIMTLNLLLIHPFYDNLKLDTSFISFLLKND